MPSPVSPKGRLGVGRRRKTWGHVMAKASNRKDGSFVVEYPEGRWLLVAPDGMGTIPLGDAIFFVEENIYRVPGDTFRVEHGGNAVLKAFLDAPFLSEKELVKRSKQRDAARILRRLRLIRGGIMQPFISCPGHKSNGGYHVAIRRA